jgi:hypothetical protein
MMMMMIMMMIIIIIIIVVHWIRPFFVGLSPRRNGFNPRPIYVGMVVYRMTLEQGFLRTLRFSSVRNVPTVAACSFVHVSFTVYGLVN